MNGAQSASGASKATIGRREGTRVAVAFLVSALTGYVVLLMAARLLVPVAENTIFVTFWSTLFACFGVMSGLSMETTRTVATGLDRSSGKATAVGPRVGLVGAVIGIGAGVLVAATSPWWAAAVFPADRAGLGLAVAAGIALYAGHSVVVGALAGQRSWVS
ncbi:MAG TPA: hypothetical protein VHA75_03480, partial [Rugosimonospora sp.]|nr:hypothetical protein [Rugosimonospora sp.]